MLRRVRVLFCLQAAPAPKVVQIRVSIIQARCLAEKIDGFSRAAGPVSLYRALVELLPVLESGFGQSWGVQGCEWSAVLEVADHRAQNDANPGALPGIQNVVQVPSEMFIHGTH